MRPAELQAASFASYPAASQALAEEYLGLLRAMPLALLPSFLVQVQEYPNLFPVEQARLQLQLQQLQLHTERMQAFAAITLTPELEQRDWLVRPGLFVNALSGYLWQTRQIDAYHRAAEELFAELFAGLPAPASSVAGKQIAPMLVAVLGQGTVKKAGGYALFQRLRKQGLYARRVDETGAAATLCALLEKRAQDSASASAYAHWYVDGGAPWAVDSGANVSRYTFPALAPVTDVVLREMDRAVREGVGPEVLEDRLRGMSAADLGMHQVTDDPRLARFFVSLLTQGSGTQLYSTSFVQASGVELARRAEPETLLLRFAPRRRPASMNDMLEQRAQGVALDPEGSLIDADMAVYATWLAMQKQPGGSRATLLAYVEGHGEAFVAGPTVPRGVESESPMQMEQVLGLLS